MKKLLATGLVLTTALVSPWAQAAGLEAQLGSHSVAVGERFELTLQSDQLSQQQPDLQPLRDQFEIVASSQSINSQSINGRRSVQQRWIISLKAKQKGELTIPSLAVGNLTSEPQTLEVVDASQLPAASSHSEVEVAVSVAKGPYYPYQEIPVTLRISAAKPLLQAELEVADSSDFELRQHGGDRRYEQRVKGARRQVIERQFMLIPQRSGEMTLPGVLLQGRLASPRGQDPFTGMGMFDSQLLSSFGFAGLSQGEAFSARSNAVKLQVKEAPLAKGQWFLPAKSVQIEASWQQQNPQFKVGEPVVRKVSLLALGAGEEQLPELEITSPAGADIYLDRSRSGHRDTDQGRLVHRDSWLSIVPSQAGSLTLPAIEVSWWDTEQNRQRQAVLPAVTIEVAATANAQPSGSKSSQPTAEVAIEPSLNQSQVTLPLWGVLWQEYGAWIVAALVAVISGLLAWWFRKPSVSSPAKPDKAPEGRVDFSAQQQREASREALAQALKSADEKAIYLQLLRWIRTEQDPQLEVQLADSLATLEARLFAADSSKAFDKALVKALLKRFSGKSENAQQAVLPALYPKHS